MNRLLVRADDLGYSEAVNYGIAKSVNEGIVRSVGVMTNMPFAKQGIELLKKTPVCYGLHTNICVGKPLTNPELIPSLVNDKGEFKSSKEYRSAEEDFVNLDEVILEIEAQYQRFVELINDKPHYFEGHAVRSDNFFKGLEIVAKRHQCEYLGNPPDHAPKFRNTVLHANVDFAKEDYNPFVSLQKAALQKYEDHGVSVMICHPGFLDAYIMRTSSLLKARVLEVEMLCAEETRSWLQDNDVQIITYDDIK